MERRVVKINSQCFFSPKGVDKCNFSLCEATGANVLEVSNAIEQTQELR